jgi:OOP family OmpA-OmpF porin
MAGRYGDRLCIYTVLVGDDPEGKALMERLSKAGSCGFSANLEDLMSSQAMADFVEKVFLVKRVMPKPAPMPKPAAAPMDSDGDGVYNDKDQCPRTPAGAMVDERGCWVIQNVEFEFDKSEIKAQYYPRLNRVVEILMANPGLKVEIAGHTDSIGSEKYNQSLSERRAQAVKAYLVGKGIPSDQLTTAGFGESKPIASNATDAGRAKNRRVELTPIEF